MNKLKIVETENAVEVNFPSSLETVNNVVEKIMNFVESKNYNGNNFKLNLVMREILNNAVEHGNKNDPDLKVNIKFKFHKDSISFQVKDEGSGFNWNLDQSENTDSVKMRGRGIALSKKSGFKLKFNKKGNIITVRKENEQIDKYKT